MFDASIVKQIARSEIIRAVEYDVRAAKRVDLNTVTRDHDKILGVGTENLRFYLRPELQTWQLSLMRDPIRTLADMTPGDALAGAMKALGITHLLVAREAAQKPAAEFPYLDRTFLQSHAALVFQDDYILVYRML